MRKRAPVQMELELPPPGPPAPRPPGLWEAVDAFPGRAEHLHRERRKLVRLRLHQVDAFELELLPGDAADE